MVGQLTQHATKRWEARTAPVDCFCVHHSATDAHITLEQIARYHVRDKDLPGIQYHYVIGADGVIYQTQPDNLFTWHAQDYNTGLGVCLLGDFTAVHPTPAQIAAARWLLAEKRREYGEIPLVGHGEAPSAVTSCPGDTWLQWRGELEEKEVTVADVWKIWPHFQGHVETPVPSRPGSHEWQELVASPGMYVTQINAFEYGKINPCPGTKWIERLWIGGDQIEAGYMWQGAKGADLMWQQHVLPALVATSPDGDPSHSWLHTVLWGNEPADILKWEFIAAFNAYNVRAAQHMHSVGREAWLGKISVGQPPEDYFKHLIPSTNAADVWVTHAYGAPTMQAEAQWYALRHEMWIDAIERNGGRVPDWFFGELGIDGGVLNNKDHPFKDEQLGWWKKGWRDWEQWNIDRGRPPYKEQLIWFNSKIQHPRFRGGNTFIHIPMDDQWLSFDHNGEMTSWECAKHRASGVVTPPVEPPPTVTLEQIIGDAVQQHIIPLNPNAALEKAGAALGLLPASDEVRDVPGYVAQAFRSPGERQWQFVAYCADGDWGNMKWFKRAN